MVAHLIIVASQKGGVGKTTVAVNLASALKLSGYRVLLIDADCTNPSVGFHLGMQEANIGLMAVAQGEARLENAIAIHGPTGLHVLPAEIRSGTPKFTSKHVLGLRKELVNSKYDFVVIDTSPGPMPVEQLSPFIVKNRVEALILLTPEMSSCASAIRLAEAYGRKGVAHTTVANRVRGRGYELRPDEIEDMLGEGLMMSLPEDDSVPAGIGARIPSCLYRGRSGFSMSMRELAAKVANRSGIEAAEIPRGRSIVAWLRRIIFVR